MKQCLRNQSVKQRCGIIGRIAHYWSLRFKSQCKHLLRYDTCWSPEEARSGRKGFSRHHSVSLRKHGNSRNLLWGYSRRHNRLRAILPMRKVLLHGAHLKPDKGFLKLRNGGHLFGMKIGELPHWHSSFVYSSIGNGEIYQVGSSKSSLDQKRAP